MQQESYLIRDAVAALLKISVSQLDAEARRGRIRRVKFGERGRARVMYRPEDIKEYIERHISQNKLSI